MHLKSLISVILTSDLLLYYNTLLEGPSCSCCQESVMIEKVCEGMSMAWQHTSLKIPPPCPTLYNTDNTCALQLQTTHRYELSDPLDPVNKAILIRVKLCYQFIVLFFCILRWQKSKDIICACFQCTCIQLAFGLRILNRLISFGSSTASLSKVLLIQELLLNNLSQTPMTYYRTSLE